MTWDEPAPRGRPWRPFLIVFVLSLAADMATKLAAAAFLDPGMSRAVAGDVVRLTLVRNSGAAFGLFPGNKDFFVVASLVALGVVGYSLRRLAPGMRWEGVALGLVAGGALGNLVDRLRLGEVVDFLDIGVGEKYRWPTFNLADTAVTVGVLLLLWWLGLRKPPVEVEKEATNSLEEAAG